VRLANGYSLLNHVNAVATAWGLRPYENHNTVSLACSDAGFDGAYRMLHAYEIRPRKDHRGVDLISDALPFGRLWYGEPNAISNAMGYAQFILLSCFGTPCVLAIPPSPTLRCAQAKEEEAETL
jgi:hypothetical protein